MDTTQKRMLEILKQLKGEHGIIAIKSEFEAEGSRSDELVMLNEIVFRADMSMFIKIGGCEAVRDLDECRLLGAAGIMAPMIETPFAMSKFVGALKKVYTDEEINDIEIIINAETTTCHQNFDAILAEGKGVLNTIAVGRVDLSGSLGLTRDDINSDGMYELTKELSVRAREKGVIAGFGGGISLEAIPFITNMADFASKFETRKVVFPISKDANKLRAGILLAMEFEMLYLKNKCAFYDRMAKEDLVRMQMLEKRLLSIQ